MAKEILSKQEFETLSHFRYQLRRFVRVSKQITHQHGITNLQYLALLHVKGFPGREWATIGELAERLQAHHHGVGTLVTRCEKLGLVNRKHGQKDRREVQVHLTAKGERTVLKLARQHRDELLKLQGVFRIPTIRELAGND